MNGKDFGYRLRILRNEQKLSIDDFSELFNVHRNTIGNIERGKSIIKLDLLECIATHFKLTLDQLVSYPDKGRIGEPLENQKRKEQEATPATRSEIIWKIESSDIGFIERMSKFVSSHQSEMTGELYTARKIGS